MPPLRVVPWFVVSHFLPFALLTSRPCACDLHTKFMFHCHRFVDSAPDLAISVFEVHRIIHSLSGLYRLVLLKLTPDSSPIYSDIGTAPLIYITHTQDPGL